MPMELYPDVVDGLEDEGGVPSRLLKTDAGEDRQEGTPWMMFAGSRSRGPMRPRSRWMTSPGKAQVALAQKTVAVLTLPGDVGAMDVAGGTAEPRFTSAEAPLTPSAEALTQAGQRIDAAESVAILAGQGARHARDELLALAERLAAPMVLTLKAKDGLERDNPYELGQTGMIGNPAARRALEASELLLMVGTDFPYVDWYPKDKVVVQIDMRGEHIGRRTRVEAGVIGDAKLALAGLLDRVSVKADRSVLDEHRGEYLAWRERPGVRHQAAQPRPRRGRAGHGPGRCPRYRPAGDRQRRARGARRTRPRPARRPDQPRRGVAAAQGHRERRMGLRGGEAQGDGHQPRVAVSSGGARASTYMEAQTVAVQRLLPLAPPPVVGQKL